MVLDMRITKDQNPASDRGFMMVALLVGMAIAAIYMTAALPAWRQQAQRVKEEDLIFRGEQYARAIMLFQDKNRGANPPDIDTLVSQHFLRKKWKDPVSGEDFVPVGVGVAVPGQTPGAAQQQTPGRAGGAPGGAQPSAPISGQQPGISGVRSKSTATSIKIYQNQQQYNYWQFDAQLLRARLGRLVQQQGGRPTGPGGERRGGEPVNPGRGQQINPGGRPGGAPGGIQGGPGRVGGSGPIGVPPGGRAGGSN